MTTSPFAGKKQSFWMCSQLHVLLHATNTLTAKQFVNIIAQKCKGLKGMLFPNYSFPGRGYFAGL